MTGTARTKAQERYAEIQKKDRGIHQDIQNAARLLHEKTAKLRQLRLAKEAEDATAKLEAKKLKAQKAAAPKKQRSRPQAAT